MKNKNLFTIPVLALTATMLFACGKGGSGKKPTPPTTYTVTFYSEGTVFDTQEVREHELAARPTTDPVKENYDFAGWYTAEEGGDEWVFSVNEIVEDTNLYAHFELGRVDFTINLLLDGQVVDTKTTNSEDKSDVLLTAVTVGEGKSLLGYADVAGTTALDVDYRVGSTLPYEDIVELADENFVVNLHAIVKTGAIQRLNIAVWSKYLDEGGFERISDAYISHLATDSIECDFLDWEMVDGSNVANFVTNFQKSDYNIVFPSINNFRDNANIKNIYVKHATVGAIVWEDTTHAKETGRCVTTFSNDDIVNDFFDWIQSDAGKTACDPDYEPPKPYPVEDADPNKLVIGVWGRWMTSEHADDVLDAWKTYATAQSITYTEAKIEYYEGSVNDSDHPYFGKADYLEAIGGNPAIDVILPVTATIVDTTEEGADSDAKKYGVTERIASSIDLGAMGLVIGGKNDRTMGLLNEDDVTASFAAFVATEDGKKALDPTYGEEVEAQTVLTISFFGNYISLANANKICEEAESYFTSALIDFTSVEPDYISAETATKNADYAAAISKDSDMSIGGGAKLSNDIFVAEGFTVTDRQNIGTIAGETNRYCSTFNNGALTTAFATYLLSTEGQAFLATLTA